MGDLILVAVVALPLIGFWLLIRGQQRRAQQVTLLAASLRVGQDVVYLRPVYQSYKPLFNRFHVDAVFM